MAAVVPATIAASLMVFGGEHQQAGFKIEFTRAWLLRRYPAGFGPVKLHHALAADARLVPQFSRDLREQGGGNFHTRAPARAFVSVRRAKLAIVRSATQRAVTVIGWIHFVGSESRWFCADHAAQSSFSNASGALFHSNNSDTGRRLQAGPPQEFCEGPATSPCPHPSPARCAPWPYFNPPG